MNLTISCLHCGLAEGVIRFGFVPCAGAKRRQRYYCNACKKPFVPPLDEAQIKLRPLERLGKEVFRGIAMYAHGLSLEQVQGHADVSVETIKSNLIKLEQQGLWDDLEKHILFHFPMVSKKSFDELLNTVRESVRRKSAFQSRSAKLRREFKNKSIEKEAEFWNEIEEMMLDDL